jgi:hypothetical protein
MKFYYGESDNGKKVKKKFDTMKSFVIFSAKEKARLENNKEIYDICSSETMTRKQYKRLSEYIN